MENKFRFAKEIVCQAGVFLKEHLHDDLDVEDLSISTLIKLIEENPSLLRRPIILDGKRMQIGFNEDEIRAFLPRGYRKEELRAATMRADI